MENNRRAVSKLAVISIALAALTVGMVCSAFLLSRLMLRVQTTEKTEKSITVKGVAEKSVTSDLAAFTCKVKINSLTRADGFKAIKTAANTLHKKLDELGFTANMREDENIDCEEQYRTITTKENGKTTSETVFDHYEVTYSVRIRTDKVQLVSQNVLKIYELASTKMDITVSAPQYFISNPEQYKLELVDKASAAAAERARTAASQSGSKLGPLMTARQGVIQITSQASNDTSDYGVYNTASLNKVIRLVMTMEFELL